MITRKATCKIDMACGRLILVVNGYVVAIQGQRCLDEEMWDLHDGFEGEPLKWNRAMFERILNEGPE